MANSDYISREAAIEALCKAHSPYPRRREISVGAIQDISPADVRPVVRGKWIDVSPAHIKVFRCDQCGEETTDTCMDKPRVNFCPNCGADMREVDNG